MSTPAPRSVDEITREWAHDFLPPGAALQGPNVNSLLRGMAIPRAALESDIASVCGEISPANSTALLADYRDLLGPDPLGRDVGDLTDNEWRYILQQRWIARGDQRLEFYLELARSWGIEITILEPQPPVCNGVVCGVDQCGDASLRFCWIVQLPTGVNRAICGVAVCGVVNTNQNDTNQYAKLQSVFRELKPADTDVYFIHDGVWING